MNISNIVAVILAGGMGTRLREVVSDRPKVLAELNGKPFIFYILDQLLNAGIKKVIISTGYLGEQVEKTIGNRYDSLKVDYSKEHNPLGTAGALKLVQQNTDTEHFLVMNGDSYVEFNIFSLLTYSRKNKANIVILTKKVEDTSRYGTIKLNENSEIVSFLEKRKIAEGGIINAGIYFLERSVFNNIPDKTPCSLEYDFFPQMIGKNIYGFETDGRFVDIGTPESYLEAKKFFQN